MKTGKRETLFECELDRLAELERLCSIWSIGAGLMALASLAAALAFASRL